ncbi:TetR/AcrR family transcriptional regulator [Pseudonocardia sp.]|uniref:TetR/AcrR family transcriptional regulator n=1 Tax=Pseudonocardia sp. TaxID=60912 RepID=UPI003D11E7DF
MPGEQLDQTGAAGRRAAPDGRRTRWDAHRAQRREQLLDAALAVLETAGPDFGMDQVAARAGVTRPVIYRHFADRAALLSAMGERAVTRLMQRLMPAVFAEGPFHTRIRTSVAAFVEFLDESPGVYRLFALHPPVGGQDVVRAGEEFVVTAVGAVLGDYLRAFGHEDEVMAEVWARGIVGLVQHTAEWWVQERTIDRDAVVDHLTRLIWAQIDGVARGYGIVLDPAASSSPDDIARRISQGE